MKRNLLLISIILLITSVGFPFGSFQPAYAAEFETFYVEQTTRQTNGTTEATISGMSIAHDSFQDGDKYLIIGRCVFDGSSTGSNYEVSMRHGTTQFSGSLQALEPMAVTTARYSYGYWTVWTAVASEGVDMRFRAQSGTIGVDNCSMFALNLTDDLTENTDWFVDEDNPTYTHTTTHTTQSTITFTPATTGHDWLVLVKSHSEFNDTAEASDVELRLSTSGTVGALTSPMIKAEGEDTGNADSRTWFASRVIENLSNAGSSTFNAQVRDDGAGTPQNQSTHSGVFALNLDVFDAHNQQYTNGASANCATTAYGTNIATTTIQPTATANVFVMGTMNFDGAGTSESLEFRLQVDNTDYVGTQTSDDYQINRPADGTDEYPFYMMSVTSLDNTSHTVDLDCSVGTGTFTVHTEERQVVAISLYIAAGGPPVYVVDLLDVYESESTTLGSGNVVCLDVDLESGSSCNGHLIVGHTYRFEIEVSETGGNAGSPTTIDIDASIGDYDVLGNLVTAQIINSGCSTNTDWSESIVSTDARGTSGTTCEINSSTAEWWIIIRIDSAAGSGAQPTATFTISDGSVSDVSTTTTFTVDNIT